MHRWRHGDRHHHRARLIPSIEELRQALGDRPGRVIDGSHRAAVAVVLADVASGPAMLFIERAARLGDPWSGQMAFPGGRVDPGDPHERAAAERETAEEVGVDLSAAEYLGRLDDVHAGIRVVSPLVLSAFVYRLDGAPPTTPNYEVREALWVPVRTLVDPAQAIRHRFGLRRFPAIVVGDPRRHVVWGLTYGLLVDLFARVDVRLASDR